MKIIQDERQPESERSRNVKTEISRRSSNEGNTKEAVLSALMEVLFTIRKKIEKPLDSVVGYGIYTYFVGSFPEH